MICKKRNEEIAKAAHEFRANDYNNRLEIEDVYKFGAAWADNHPCLDKLWHSTKEVPEEHRPLLQRCFWGWEVDDYISKTDGPWQYYVKQYNMQGWMYADEFTNTITKLKK